MASWQPDHPLPRYYWPHSPHWHHLVRSTGSRKMRRPTVLVCGPAWQFSFYVCVDSGSNSKYCQMPFIHTSAHTRSGEQRHAITQHAKTLGVHIAEGGREHLKRSVANMLEAQSENRQTRSRSQRRSLRPPETPPGQKTPHKRVGINQHW